MPAGTDPLLIGSTVTADKQNLVGFCVGLVNSPGSLGRVLTELGRLGVNVPLINFSAGVPRGGVGTVFIVAELPKGLEPEAVAGKIGSISGVTRVKVVKPQFLGLLVDTCHFPIVDNLGNRVLIYTTFNIESFAVRLRREFGKAGLAFLYHEGVVTGEALAEAYRRWGIERLDDALRVNILRAYALGRYRGKLVDYADSGISGRAVIRAWDMWECEAAKRHGIREPSCYFEKGVIAGIVRGYVGQRMKIREVKCVAMGDPYCEFVVEYLRRASP